MKINLTINQAEFEFIKHSIWKQTHTLSDYMDAMYKVAEHLDPIYQVKKFNEELEKSNEKVSKSLKELNKSVEQSEIDEEPKKPHWTQTAKGRKIMAARKRKGQK
jgi:methyltransferase-like protein